MHGMYGMCVLCVMHVCVQKVWVCPHARTLYIHLHIHTLHANHTHLVHMHPLYITLTTCTHVLHYTHQAQQLVPQIPSIDIAAVQSLRGGVVRFIVAPTLSQVCCDFVIGMVCTHCA